MSKILTAVENPPYSLSVTVPETNDILDASVLQDTIQKLLDNDAYMRAKIDELEKKCDTASIAASLEGVLSVTNTISGQRDVTTSAGPYYGAGYILMKTHLSEYSFASLSDAPEKLTLTIDGVVCTTSFFLKSSNGYYPNSTEGRTKAYDNVYDKNPFTKSVKFDLPKFPDGTPHWGETVTYSIYLYK